MNLSPTKAESIIWCHEFGDAVHAADWLHLDGGWLTTLTEVDGVDVCDFDSPAPLSELRAGLVKPWRDRGMFGAPVCEHCENDVNELMALAEFALEADQ